MMEEFGECLLSDPINFNISSEEIYDSKDGTLFNRTYLFTQDQFQFYVDYIEMNNKRYPLSNSVLNNEIIQDYLLIDSFKLKPWPYYDQTKKNPLNISNEVKVDEKSTISFFRNRIQVANMKNASASGW